MEKSQAKVKIDELINEIERHNRLYYVESNPIISDQKYDMLVRELEGLEEKFPDLVKPYSPTLRVSSDLVEGFERVEHKEKMLSLKNAYDEKEIEAFYNSVIKKFPGSSFTVMLKYDGASIKLRYKNGVLMQALSRGDGSVGDDIIQNARTIKNVPLRLETEYPVLDIVGEVLMPKSVLSWVNKEREEPFANCRSAANGTIKLLNPKEVSKRKLIVKVFGVSSNINIGTHIDTLYYLKDRGLPVDIEEWKDSVIVTESLECILEFYRIWQKSCQTLDYDIDGLVIRVNEAKTCEELGDNGKHPRYAIAAKFKAEEYEAKLLDVIYQVGRSGSINPVGILEPVEMNDGTTVSRATLNNTVWMDKQGISHNDVLTIIKSGEIIPKVIGIAERGEDAQKFNPPLFCPSCGSGLVKRGDAGDYCENIKCPDRVKKGIEYFASRGCMDIGNLGEKSVEVLYSEGFITSIQGIYEFAENETMKQSLGGYNGWGTTSVNTLVEGIKKSKEKKLEVLLKSLGLSSIGKSTAEDLVEEFKNLRTIAGLNILDLKRKMDYKDKTANNVYAGLKELDPELVVYLYKNGFNVAQVKDRVEPDVKYLEGKKVVVSGVFENFERDELKNLVRDYGGTAQSSVNGKTDYLLAGDKAGPAKLEKAKDLGVEVIDIDTFLELIDIM